MRKDLSSNNNLVFSPASEPQSQFLLSDAFFTIYGGAVFSGKSFCLLGSMLPIIQYPGTRAVIIRKTTKMLTGSGGLFDAAIHLYSKVDPRLKVKSRDLILTFSTGAEIQFTYLDKPADRMNIQGREYSRICFDEAQQLDGDNILYALSRLRSTRVKYPLQAHATCNPDPDSFLMPFVEHLLDDNLVPIRSKSYPNRYFVRDNGKLMFYASMSEAIADGAALADIKTYKFVPGSIYDNPVGLESNKGYISTLQALPPIERRRLLEGAWVRESKSGYFKREWISIEPYPSMTAKNRVRSWDLAFSEASESRPRVDASAGVLMSKTDKNMYTVENVITLRKRVHEVEKAIFDTAAIDGQDVRITLPLDPGATAGAYCRDLARQLSEKGYSVKLIRPERGKLQRFLPFASTAEAGYVHVVKSDWTEAYLNELEQTEFNSKTFDDQADATSDAFFALNQTITLPDMSLPDLTGSNPFAGVTSQIQTYQSIPDFF